MVVVYAIQIFMVIFVNLKNVQIIAVRMEFAIIKLVSAFASLDIQMMTAL